MTNQPPSLDSNFLTETELPEFLAWLKHSGRESEMDMVLTAPSPLWQPQPTNLPQQRAYECTADVIGYGGAAGGGKSDLALGLAVMKHQRSIIFRREFTQLRAIIDRSREILVGSGRYNETLHVWRNLPGGRQLEFGGMADPGDEQKYRGQPHDLIAFDEADQFLERQVRFVQAWLRTTIPGQLCQVLICFNPPATAEGRWLVQYFAPWVDDHHSNPAAPGELRWYGTDDKGDEVERPDAEPYQLKNGETIRPKSRTFFPAKMTDNAAWRTTNYAATLQALPEPLRSQLLYGDFAAGIPDDAWQLIPTAWVKAAQARWTPQPPTGQALTCIGADVARGGADFTVPVLRYGPWIKPPRKYKGVETDDGPKAAGLILRDHDGKAPVYIDAIGLGSSAYDFAKAHIGSLAVAVNVAAASDRFDKSGRYRLTNIRAVIWWALRTALDPESGENIMLPPGNEVLGDLTAPRFELLASGYKVEAKEKIKERIGRSPDVGDAIALCFRPPKAAAFIV